MTTYPTYVKRYIECERCGGLGLVARATGRRPDSMTLDAGTVMACPSCLGHGQVHREVAVSITYDAPDDGQLHLL